MTKHGPANKPCIACGQNNWTLLDYPEGALLRCGHCGLARLRDIPKTRETNKYYDTFYDTKDSERFLPILEKLMFFFRTFRIKTTIAYAGPRGLLLDVGFGRPSDLSRYSDFGWIAEGTQIVPHVVAIARQKGLQAYLGDLPSLRIPKGRFNAVTLWHVMEHLHNPSEYLKKIRDILTPDGKLILEVPNAGSPSARFFGRHWFDLDPPNHLFHFTEKSLELLLAKNRFTISAEEYFSPEQSVFSLIQSTLNRWTGKRNVLFESLKKHGKRYGALEVMGHLVLAAVLFPFALALSTVFARIRRGSIIRLYCAKQTSGEKPLTAPRARV